MPDRIVYAVVGTWVASLLALLTVGRSASEGVVFVLFGLMISSVVFVVANCYGVVGLLRLLGWAVAPIAVGVLIAAVERRKRSRQRVPNW